MPDCWFAKYFLFLQHNRWASMRVPMTSGWTRRLEIGQVAVVMLMDKLSHRFVGWLPCCFGR